MTRYKKSIFTVLLAVTFCGNEAFGAGEEADRPSNTVGTRLGGGAAPSSQVPSSDGIERRADVINFGTGRSMLLTYIKTGPDTWLNDMQVTWATSEIEEKFLNRRNIDASQIVRIPFSPQVLERPEFAPYKEDILKASITPKRTISGSSSYNRSSTSTKTINGRTVAQGGRKTSTNSSKAKVIKCANGRAVVISEENSEARGPGAYNANRNSRTNAVRTDEVTPEYLAKLGVQPSDVVWENSPDSSDNVQSQLFSRDASAALDLLSDLCGARGGLAKSRTSRVPSPTKPVARTTPLRPTVAAPAPKPQAGKQIGAMRSSIPARSTLQPARPQRAMAAPSGGRRIGISSSTGVRGVPVRVANRNPQNIQKRVALPLTRRTSVTARPQVVRKPALVASSRRASIVSQRKSVASVLRQAPVRNTSLRAPMRAPITGRPTNSRLP